MSSGSYFTIYKKCTKKQASSDKVAALKNEYFLANKNGPFSGSEDEDALKKDIPALMRAEFKADGTGDIVSDIYYDADGYEYTRLLDFHFGSVFTSLKEHFMLNQYKFSKSSVQISKNEAAKILQAIDYILGEEYSKKFEDILSNEYVELLGEGYTPFDSRFKSKKSPMHIDKKCHGGYVVSFGDHGFEREAIENDNDMKFCLNRTRACLLAFLNAEEYTYNGEELILEYSAY